MRQYACRLAFSATRPGAACSPATGRPPSCTWRPGARHDQRVRSALFGADAVSYRVDIRREGRHHGTTPTWSHQAIEAAGDARVPASTVGAGSRHRRSSLREGAAPSPPSTPPRRSAFRCSPPAPLTGIGGALHAHCRCSGTCRIEYVQQHFFPQPGDVVWSPADRGLGSPG